MPQDFLKSENLDALRQKGYHTFDLENEYGERKLAQTGLDHKAKGCKVTYNPDLPWPKYYPAAGEATFTDGIIGGWTYSDQRWQGFLSPIDVTIDLGSVQEVHYVGGTFMQLIGPGVFMPAQVIVSVSTDGEHYTELQTIDNEVVRDDAVTFKTLGWEGSAEARYVRYQARRSDFGGFLFIDEVVVR